MGQLENDQSNLELLLRFAAFGRVITEALDRTAGTKITDNVSMIVLCHLELTGPRRPNELVELTGLTSGGVTKVVTRLETAGLVSRTRRSIPGDRRAVEVALTDSGHEMMSAFDRELGLQISDASVLIKELNRLVE